MLETELQIWLQLCGRDNSHHGSIYMVHDQNHRLEVCWLHSMVPGIAEIVFRTNFRREANKADNKAATVSVDALINYEAVKVSCLHISCSHGAQ